MTPVRGIEPSEICVIWPRIEELVQLGLGPDCGQTPDDLFTSLECEQAQLFATPTLDCILMTEIDLLPEEKVMNIFLAAGKLPKDYGTVLRALEGWARFMLCDAMEIRSFRKGMIRLLRPHGYRVVEGLLRKELRQ